MILVCNSCDKKFVVPDQAISAAGRMVQCGSCGNKWKQFPVNEIIKDQSIPSPQKVVSKSQPVQQKVQKPKKIKKKTTLKKPREISLYSPEYLAKKHGITITDSEPQKVKSFNSKNKVSLGFYGSLLVFLVFVIFFSRSLYFAQDIIVSLFPNSEFYFNYFFENVRNIFDIWKNLISNY